MSFAEREERNDDEEAFKLEDTEDYKVFKCLMKNGSILNENMQKVYFRTLDQPMVVKYISNEKAWASRHISSYFLSKEKEIKGTVIKLLSPSRHFCKRNKVSRDGSSLILGPSIYLVKDPIVEFYKLDKYTTLYFRYMIGNKAFRVHTKTGFIDSYFVPQTLKIQRSNIYNEDLTLECVGFIDLIDIRYNFFVL